jgi:hypothetical protein
MLDVKIVVGLVNVVELSGSSTLYILKKGSSTLPLTN